MSWGGDVNRVQRSAPETPSLNSENATLGRARESALLVLERRLNLSGLLPGGGKDKRG